MLKNLFTFCIAQKVTYFDTAQHKKMLVTQKTH